MTMQNHTFDDISTVCFNRVQSPILKCISKLKKGQCVVKTLKMPKLCTTYFKLKARSTNLAVLALSQAPQDNMQHITSPLCDLILSDGSHILNVMFYVTKSLTFSNI